jgi:anaphase-promoting complex subunit 10
MPRYQGYRVTKHLIEDNMIEVGHLGLWSASTSKSKCGIENLRDDNLDTFWQSDSIQPHKITIQYTRCMPFTRISFYVNGEEDESYAPHHMSIRAGNSLNALLEVKRLKLEMHKGWIHVDLGEGAENTPIQACIVQLVILKNFDRGRDTHLRQVKIYAAPSHLTFEPDLASYTSPEFQALLHVR